MKTATNHNLFQTIILVFLSSCYSSIAEGASTKFPLHEFLSTSSINVSNSSDFMVGAELFYLCSSGQRSMRCCECDDECFHRRSCCIDKLWNPLRPIPLEDYMELFRNTTLHHLKTECQPVQPYASYHNFKIMFQESDYKDGYQMVSRCKSNSSSFAIKCTNDEMLSNFDRLPVISTSGDYLIFKNKYCTLCNDIKSFRNLNISLGCGKEIQRSTTTTPTTTMTTMTTNKSATTFTGIELTAPTPPQPEI